MSALRFRVLRSVALIGAVLAALLGVSAVATAATPTPTPSSGQSTPVAKKPPTVTFGLGPSNGKSLDGRPSFSYTTNPGAVINDHVALVNISAQPLTLLLYGADALEATGGTLAYRPFNATHTGASTWLALPEVNGSQEIVVKARSTLILPFQIRVPSNASPGDHTAGIAVGLIADVEGKSTKNLKLEQRVVAQVALRVSGTPVAKLEIDKLHATYNQSWNPFGQGSVTLTYLVKNTGNVNLGAKQIAKMSGLFGDVGSIPTPPAIALLLPGASAAFTLHVKDIWPEIMLTGKVSVTPIGLPNSIVPTLQSTSASTTVWAIPWALLLLLLILIVGGYLLLRFRRKRAATRRRPSHSRARKGDKIGSSDGSTLVPAAREDSDNA